MYKVYYINTVLVCSYPALVKGYLLFNKWYGKILHNQYTNKMGVLSLINKYCVDQNLTVKNPLSMEQVLYINAARHIQTNSTALTYFVPHSLSSRGRCSPPDWAAPGTEPQRAVWRVALASEPLSPCTAPPASSQTFQLWTQDSNLQLCVWQDSSTTFRNGPYVFYQNDMMAPMTSYLIITLHFPRSYRQSEPALLLFKSNGFVLLINFLFLVQSISLKTFDVIYFSQKKVRAKWVM